MKGDYSRNTFDPRRHFSSVFLQQGRVLLDADANEQTAILLRYLRTLAADLIGPHGGPARRRGFAIGGLVLDTPGKIHDLQIGAGRYWVDGVLCENEEVVTYTGQPDFVADDLSVLLPPLLVYLDVWERHVTAVEDPRILEVALGGPDTAARAQVVWRVRVRHLDEVKDQVPDKLNCRQFETIQQWIDILTKPLNRGRLAARAHEPDIPPATPCIVAPQSRYRGLENQLYRVEIHKGGTSGATFKWSRENGSVVFPIQSAQGALVTVEHLGRDERFGLAAGDWVEVVDDATAFDERYAPQRPLYQVEDLDESDRIVTLSGTPAPLGQARHPFLRRWDQQDTSAGGGLTLVGGAATIDAGKWLELEDGIQIWFTPGADYSPGDYWLIPARTATGDVEWPAPGGGGQLVDGGRAVSLPPHGVDHHYAPLGVIVRNPGAALSVTDLRHVIEQAAVCLAVVGIKVVDTNPDTIILEAIVDTADSTLTYHWTVTGGTVDHGDRKKVTITTPGPLAPVMAILVVHGFPEGYASTASATYRAGPDISPVLVEPGPSTESRAPMKKVRKSPARKPRKR